MIVKEISFYTARRNSLAISQKKKKKTNSEIIHIAFFSPTKQIVCRVSSKINSYKSIDINKNATLFPDLTTTDDLACHYWIHT